MKYEITKLKKLLKQYFGYDDFKTGQREVIEQIAGGRDALAVMPTGAGKSICYQLAALMLDGITLVISPLISLMKDQVDALSQTGIKAAYLNSTLNASQLAETVRNAKSGKYKLIYIAPERLETEALEEIINTIPVSLVAVDEAHCISQWGHDFRPSYVRISDVIEKIHQRPVVAAFTATATPLVKQDIQELLKLQNPYLLTTGFDRKNLYFDVIKTKDKNSELFSYLKQNSNKSGIIYASTRKTVDKLFETLQQEGFRAARYHAGMSESERAENQDDFINDRVEIMIATNAFGMGIDKSNVSFVIHYNMPKNLESYYQEAGRAGRDGEKADCILYFSASDIITDKFLIERTGDESEKTGEYEKLQKMIDYCNTDKCLRAYILNYFNDENAITNCGNCGNCNNKSETTDITIEAQKILSCIKRMGERYGSGLLSQVLRGRQTKKIETLGFDRLSTFGIMKDYGDEAVKELVSYLISEGYIGQIVGQYPVLNLQNSAYQVLRGRQTVTIRRAVAKGAPKYFDTPVENQLLFESLRAIRREIAANEQVAPFVVFSDATLRAMCRQLPSNRSEMLRVPGIGETKLEKYGQRFLDTIQKYISDNGIKRDCSLSERPKAGGHTEKYSYELYRQGLKISEIAAKRSLTESTIEHHLLKCYAMGLPLDDEIFVSRDQEQLIINAINKNEDGRLKPIKDTLPDEISYAAIRFVMIKQRMEKRTV